MTAVFVYFDEKILANHIVSPTYRMICEEQFQTNTNWSSAFLHVIQVIWVSIECRLFVERSIFLPIEIDSTS